MTFILGGLFLTAATEWFFPLPSRVTPWMSFYAISLTFALMLTLAALISIAPARLIEPQTRNRIATAFIAAGVILTLSGYQWGGSADHVPLPRFLAAILAGSTIGLTGEYFLDKLRVRAWLDRRERKSNALLTSTNFAKALTMLFALYLVHAARGDSLDDVLALGITLNFCVGSWIIQRLGQRNTVVS